MGTTRLMGYLVGAVFLAIAVVLFIFTGVWGGLIWVVVAGGLLLFVSLGSAMSFRRPHPEPTGVPRSGTGEGTANQRVDSA